MIEIFIRNKSIYKLKFLLSTELVMNLSLIILY